MEAYLLDIGVLSTCLILTISAAIYLSYNVQIIIPEIKLLLVGLFFIPFLFIGTLPAIYSIGNKILMDNELLVLFNKLSFVISQSGILLISLAIFLPEFKPKYRFIFYLIVITSINIAAAIFNFLTISHIVINGNLLVQYKLIGLFLSTLSVIILPILILKRAQNAKKLTNVTNPPYFQTQPLIIFSLIVFSASLSFILGQMRIIITNSNFLYSIPTTLAYLYFCYSISKSNELLFITEVSWKGQIILNKENGIILFSHSFLDQNKSNLELIPGLISILNESLTDQLKTNKGLQEIKFGDKVYSINSGDWIISIMILSGTNMITQSIGKYITRKFEENYPKKILAHSKLIDKQLLSGFEDEIHKIKPFIPL